MKLEALGAIDKVELNVSKARREWESGRDSTLFITQAKQGIESLAFDVECRRVYWRLENLLQSLLADMLKQEARLLEASYRIHVVEVALAQPAIIEVSLKGGDATKA